jgi:hypothetical protein
MAEVLKVNVTEQNLNPRRLTGYTIHIKKVGISNENFLYKKINVEIKNAGLKTISDYSMHLIIQKSSIKVKHGTEQLNPKESGYWTSQIRVQPKSEIFIAREFIKFNDGSELRPIKKWDY